MQATQTLAAHTPITIGNYRTNPFAAAGIACFAWICDTCRTRACNPSQIVAEDRPRIEPSKQQLVTENEMNKVIIALMVIFFLGDPGMETIAWLGEMKNYVVAAAIAMVSMPFIVSQLDG